MQFSASTKYFYTLALLSIFIVACGPNKSPNYIDAAPQQHSNVPPPTPDADNDYDPVRTPMDNDGDWYYNYYNVEY